MFFSPNGDNNNDKFFPLTKGASGVNKILIFDRLGRVGL